MKTDKPKFVAVLVFVRTTASFIEQISSSENVSKRDAILAPVAKQWIAKDISSYGSQSKRAKIAIHWFLKYLIVVSAPEWSLFDNFFITLQEHFVYG